MNIQMIPCSIACVVDASYADAAILRANVDEMSGRYSCHKGSTKCANRICTQTVFLFNNLDKAWIQLLKMLITFPGKTK